MFNRFLKLLRLKQREHPIVDSIADILLDFFSSMSAQKLKSAYGEFLIKFAIYWTLHYCDNSVQI